MRATYARLGDFEMSDAELIKRASAFVPMTDKAKAMREVCADLFDKYGHEWTENEQYAFIAVGCFLRLCEDIEAVDPAAFVVETRQ